MACRRITDCSYKRFKFWKTTPMNWTIIKIGVVDIANDSPSIMTTDFLSKWVLNYMFILIFWLLIQKTKNFIRKHEDIQS